MQVVEFLDVYGDASLILNVTMISLIRKSTAGKCWVRIDGKEYEVNMTCQQLIEKSKYVKK